MVSERAFGALVRVAVGLAVLALARELDAGELGLRGARSLLAAGVVAFGLGGVVADDEALGGVAVADADFLDAQVVADGPVAARAGQRGLRVRASRRAASPAI